MTLATTPPIVIVTGLPVGAAPLKVTPAGTGGVIWSEADSEKRQHLARQTGRVAEGKSVRGA